MELHSIPQNNGVLGGRSDDLVPQLLPLSSKARKIRCCDGFPIALQQMIVKQQIGAAPFEQAITGVDHIWIGGCIGQGKRISLAFGNGKAETAEQPKHKKQPHGAEVFLHFQSDDSHFVTSPF